MISVHDHGNCELCDAIEAESEQRRLLVGYLIAALEEIIADSSCSAYAAQVAQGAIAKARA